MIIGGTHFVETSPITVCGKVVADNFGEQTSNAFAAVSCPVCRSWIREHRLAPGGFADPVEWGPNDHETIDRAEAERRLRALDCPAAAIVDGLDNARAKLIQWADAKSEKGRAAHAILRAYVRGLDAQAPVAVPIPSCAGRLFAYECALPAGHGGYHATEGGFTRWPDSADTRKTVDATPTASFDRTPVQGPDGKFYIGGPCGHEECFPATCDVHEVPAPLSLTDALAAVSVALEQAREAARRVDEPHMASALEQWARGVNGMRSLIAAKGGAR